MRGFLKILIIAIIVAGIFAFAPLEARATTFDLLAPSGQLQRGQNVNFTINIDTEGRSLTSTQIGMTYDTTVLGYVSISPGNTFTTVSTDNQGNGRLLITGSKDGGFSGTGSFAVVTFQIIAQSSGSTQVCALFNPSSPTPISPTGVPAPTSLPRTGSVTDTNLGIISGVILLGIAALSMIFLKRV